MLTRTSKRELRARQIAHIKEHQIAFNRHGGNPAVHRDVEAYFDDYWDAERPRDLYRCLCADLSLVVRESCLR